MTVLELRKEFPGLSNDVNGVPLVYFDNAATAQRPYVVTESILRAELFRNANIRRAVHTLADKATQSFEQSRDAAVTFLNAGSREEIVFTAGATSAINMVAYSFGEIFVGEGDEIIIGEGEHHSDFVPWQMLARRKGAKALYLPVGPDGTYEPEVLRSMLTDRTRIVCFCQASNVLGLVNPVREMTAVCHSRGVPVFVDGAQGAVHVKTDVRELDCDFYTFSAHKVYGPTGVGVLYGKKTWLDRMPPFLYGGEMVGTVSKEGTTFAPLPMKFEAGTQNFNSVASLSGALELAGRILADGELNAGMAEVKSYILDELLKINGLTLYGMPGKAEKLPIFSFCIEGVHHEDMALLLDKMGIAVRSGQMCAEPLMDHFGVKGMLRASLLPYNTLEEAERFIKGLGKAVKMLQ